MGGALERTDLSNPCVNNVAVGLILIFKNMLRLEVGDSATRQLKFLAMEVQQFSPATF